MSNQKDYTDWMRNAMREDEYMDEFHLAVACCSDHELWEEDYSIPEALIEQAKKVFTEESKSE